MRRADRLFQIVQLLRRKRAVTTAARIAERLRVSERTIFPRHPGPGLVGNADPRPPAPSGRSVCSSGGRCGRLPPGANFAPTFDRSDLDRVRQAAMGLTFGEEPGRTLRDLLARYGPDAVGVFDR